MPPLCVYLDIAVRVTQVLAIHLLFNRGILTDWVLCYGPGEYDECTVDSWDEGQCLSPL